MWRMVKKIIYVGMLCSALLWWGCSQTEPDKAITVEVDLNVGNDTDSIEDIFAIERLIPLQANGMISSVDKLYKQDSLIYVLDQKQMALFIFNRMGEPKLTLKKIGRAAGEYLSLDDFAVDEEGNIFLFDTSLQRISRYDAEGVYIDKIDVGAGTGFILTGADSLVVYRNILGESNLTVFKTNGTKLQDIDYPEAMPNILLTQAGGVLEHDGKLYFTNPLNYTLYSVEGNEARPVYTFDFGDQNLPQDILEEKDRKLLLQRIITFNGVRFLKNVAFHDGRLFFATDGNIQCIMDIQAQQVTVLDHMVWPYVLLLNQPVTICPDGTFLTFVTAPNMESLFSQPEEQLKNYSFPIPSENIPPMEVEDYWVVEGHIE